MAENKREEDDTYRHAGHIETLGSVEIWLISSAVLAVTVYPISGLSRNIRTNKKTRQTHTFYGFYHKPRILTLQLVFNLMSEVMALISS